MSSIYNEQQQKNLTRAIAMRALMYARGDNCYCPVKKPTKFIVTLKPVIKMPHADPYLNLNAQASGCTCNVRNAQKNTTVEHSQVRSNNDALKGKTLLSKLCIKVKNLLFVLVGQIIAYGYLKFKKH